MTYRTAAAEALAEWRDAEARMEEADPLGPEWQDAFAEARQAKSRYQDAVDAASAADSADPPPVSSRNG